MSSNHKNIKDQRLLTYGEAIREATAQEMARDPSVTVLGLGADDVKGLFGTTKDLHNEFGRARSFDTPLSEDAMTGAAIGMAMSGLRPIHIHQRMDFVLLCMNQLVNIAAKSSYVFAGQQSVPLVIRNVIGRSWGQGAQHSQSFHNYFMHVPGIKVFAPSTPYDVKGALITSIRDNNPVVFVEHRMLYSIQGHVPEEQYEVEFGKARILKAGSDVTIVAISHMTVEAVRAAKSLEEKGISAEVIDPVSLYPLDIDLISKSVAKTGRLIVVDCAWLNAGASAEIITQIIEAMDGQNSVQFARMGFAESPCPTAQCLENAFYPNSQKISKKVYHMITGKEDWEPFLHEAEEVKAFRGPF